MNEKCYLAHYYSVNIVFCQIKIEIAMSNLCQFKSISTAYLFVIHQAEDPKQVCRFNHNNFNNIRPQSVFHKGVFCVFSVFAPTSMVIDTFKSFLSFIFCFPENLYIINNSIHIQLPYHVQILHKFLIFLFHSLFSRNKYSNASPDS